LALFVALGGSAYAVTSSAGSSSASGNSIHSCYSNRTGALRLLLSGQCRRGETELTWNQRGRRGPIGRRGPRGPQGVVGTGGSGDAYTKSQSDNRFLAIGGQAADSAKLGGVPAAEYLLSNQTAADAAKLGGVPAGDYLTTNGTIANASTLQGHPASDFAPSSLFGPTLTPTPGSAASPNCFAGEVALFAGVKIPAGWVLADGRALNKGDFTALNAVLSSKYGADSQTFNVPDLRAANLTAPNGINGAGAEYAICATGAVP
jgi:hypothetical protein